MAGEKLVSMNGESIDPEREVEDLVVTVPAFAQVFEAVGIDYCCGGDISLTEACENEDLDVSQVRERLATVREQQGGSGRGSLAHVINDIVRTHHRYLREEVPVLESLIHIVSCAHGNSHTELPEIEREFCELAETVRAHISVAEDDVFPVVRRLDSGDAIAESEARSARETIETLADELTAAVSHLDAIATVSDGYTVPEDACERHREVLERLEALDQDIRMYVHKETNILLPQAKQQLRCEDSETVVPYPTAHGSLLDVLDRDVEPSLQ